MCEKIVKKSKTVILVTWGGQGVQGTWKALVILCFLSWLVCKQVFLFSLNYLLILGYVCLLILKKVSNHTKTKPKIKNRVSQ